MNTLSQSRLYKTASTLTILLALFLVCGCDELLDNQPPPPKKAPETVNFGIVIFDEAGTEGTSFRKGTDIKIGFKLVTDGGGMIQWRKADECQLFASQEFLLVYQSNESLDKPPTSYHPLGTPYNIPDYCAGVKLTSKYIGAGTVIVSFPWSSNPDNKPFVAGRYYATATLDLIIDGKVKHWDIKHDFEIYN